jgi:hypothetical protein
MKQNKKEILKEVKWFQDDKLLKATNHKNWNAQREEFYKRVDYQKITKHIFDELEKKYPDNKIEVSLPENKDVIYFYVIFEINEKTREEEINKAQKLNLEFYDFLNDEGLGKYVQENDELFEFGVFCEARFSDNKEEK